MNSCAFTVGPISLHVDTDANCTSKKVGFRVRH